MKRIPIIALLLVALFALAACGQATPTPEPAVSTETGTSTETEATAVAPTEPNEPPAGYPAQPAGSETASGYPAAPAVADAPSGDGYPASEAAPSTESTESDIRTFIVASDQSTARYLVAETFFEGATDRFGIPAGLATTIGEAQTLEGELTLDFGQSPIALQAANFTVDISALRSDQSMRDNTLRERWLESNQYPIASFVASGMENFPAEYAEGSEVSFQLVGEITIREITQPVTWDVTATLNNGVISGTAVAPLTMTDFGFDPPNFAGLFTIEPDFEVEVDFVAEQGG